MNNELLNYIFSECDFEYDRTRSNILSIDFPDYEDVVDDYDMELNKKDYNQAIKTITDAINKADYWYCNNEATDYILLDANVDFDVDTDKISEDEFWGIIEGYDSRNDIDVYFINDGSDPIFYACAEFTLENLLKYDELVKEAKKLEKTLFKEGE